MEKTRMPEYWETAKRSLSRRDKTLGRIIRAYKGESLASRRDAFFSLARAIVGQQISVKAADSVWKKLETGIGGDITPQGMLGVSEEALRGFGLSRQKALYLRELADFFRRNPGSAWHEQYDEDVIKTLIAVKGIGRWSAEMFLIFHLLRPDVFPVADIGLQKALEKHYNNGVKMKPADMKALGECWKPYRSVATWYLWRSLDPVAVEY